ncbi:ribosomal protein L11 methyltransferase PrmA [Gottschalkia acidurici 9a]|uniref:Ribosomal protein L11 methyltransferase n=1 Tax=Gottschalkia acidurici (strain ATCC 7906 / DSM 604 / BCRC 14475 / CIP 104303 / KCTC 5404 / NCIMB 10678 / 9a) TaxID=1128398 RepID=K0B2J1_GOTA9|nr:50S ribosomal protein L11 methyltransferase [Gottschalkia acidurici]AFS78831.1 ribosomal protein L11 methyltransferase PrmA [Gottschalkia acidurici 9a]
MKWIEVQVKTTSEAVEVVSNILYEVGAGGLAIEDPNDIEVFVQSKTEEDWNFIDSSLFENKFDGAIVKAYFPENENLIEKVELIKQNIAMIPEYNLDKGLGEVTISEVHEKDWAHAWKKYYKPTKIGEKIVVKPSWEEYEEQDGEIVLELDPGMAFGTGTHETTTMCIQALEKHVKEGDLVLDIGCGSGILSVAAAKLGAKKAIGVDLDELAVKVSNENKTINNVQDIVDIRHGNLLDVVSEKADVVVANIIAEIVVILAKDIKKCLLDDGVFISSGIILDKIERVKQGLDEEGLDVMEVVTMGEWACIVSKLKEGNKNA